MRAARLALLLSLPLLAACGGAGAAVGADETVVGEVLGLEMTALAHDGDALVILRTADGLRTVRVPARIEQCETHEIVALDSLRPGDRVEARGAARGRDIIPCTSSTHYFRRAADERPMQE